MDFGRWVRWFCMVAVIELLGSRQFLFQRLGHLGGRRAGKVQPHLNGVIDEPLSGRQGTNHDDTGRKTLPETGESEFLGRLHGCRALLFVHQRNNRVGRVRNDGAEHTGDVTGCERHNQLFTLGAVSARLRHNMPVNENTRKTR